MDADAYHPKRDTRAEVIAALRDLMHLGPNDPAPQPPPAKVETSKTGDKATGDKAAGDKDKDKDKKDSPKAVAVATEQ
jgi:hypothetical protein